MAQLFGAILLWLGGLSAASFYAPVHRVKQWAWATYWISLGFVAWIIMPTVGGLLVTNDLFQVLSESPMQAKLLAYLFGVLWGFGGLMAALALRYLGLGLGNSIALGICAIVGTLVPAFMDNKLGDLVSTQPGQVISLGLFVCLIGIVFCGWAGYLKEQTMTKTADDSPNNEFAFGKGLLVGIGGGIMSAFMAISLAAGDPIAKVSLAHGTQEVFANIPILVFSLAGGFTTNFIYTMILNIRDKRMGDWFLADKGLLLCNLFWAVVSGLMWYGQYFFYGMGTTQMGDYKFASWSIFMASIVICANLWGIALKEWKQATPKTKGVLWIGILILIVSICLVGWGNYLTPKQEEKPVEKPAPAAVAKPALTADEKPVPAAEPAKAPVKTDAPAAEPAKAPVK